MKQENLNAAQVGKMYVTEVRFAYHEAGQAYNGSEHVQAPEHWAITATLSDKPGRYGQQQTMTIKVEKEIGNRLAEILLPVIIADASEKAQQLADDSKAMLAALGERTIKCIVDMPKAEEESKPEASE